MSRWRLALLLTGMLALPAVGQTPGQTPGSTPAPTPAETPGQSQEQPKKARTKVAIPPNTFFKGQTSSQYLAGEQLIGAKVTNKDGQTIGTISDLIVGSGDRIDGVILAVGGLLGVGEKKIGVRLPALKLSRDDGKLAVSLPNASKEILSAVPAYERAGAAERK